MIAQVRTVDDVVRSVNAARDTAMLLAVRGGGHNGPGLGTCDDGLVIDLAGLWDVDHGDAVLKAYREFLPNAPRKLNGLFAYVQVPPAPPFPEELHLRPACAVVWAYLGDEDGARSAMAPLLEAVPEPLPQGVAAMPHAALQSAFDALFPKGRQSYWRADFVNTIPDEAVEVHQRFGSGPATATTTPGSTRSRRPTTPTTCSG